jgi:peroxiredoxin
MKPGGLRVHARMTRTLLSLAIMLAATLAAMNEMQAKYGARGLQVVGINLDRKRDDADRFLAELPAAFTIAFDAPGDSAKRFGVKGMPTSVLIGPDGKVLFMHTGFRIDERAQLEARIAAALP